MAFRIRIDSRVRIEAPNGFELERICAEFQYPNPSFGDARRPDEQETIRTWRQDSSNVLSVPRGGIERVLEIQAASMANDAKLGRDAGRGVRSDARTWRYPEPGFPDCRIALRPYQERMVDAAESATTCLLRAPTGSGKTTAAIALLARLKRRSLVGVWEGGLERQWRERLRSELDISPENIGTVRGSETRIRPVTIAMIQTLYRRFSDGDRSLADAFDVVVGDEIQRAAADSLYAVFDEFSALYRIGISADETRRDGKEQLTYDLFGDVACSVDSAELVESGAIVDVEMLVVPTGFQAGWYRYRQDFNRLLNKMCADETRNALLLDVVGRIVRQGHQCLVFTHRVEHARQLDARLTGLGIRSDCMLGGVENKEAYDVTRDAVRAGRARVGIGTYGAIAQGIDLPTVSRGVVATPIGGNKQLLNQVKGRLCRQPGDKRDAKLVFMWDRLVYGKKVLRNLCSWFDRVSLLEGERWVSAKEWLAKN